jgi:hypothetical protein
MNTETEARVPPPFLEPDEAERDPTIALTKLLRGAGAVLLLSSAVTFLLQRWNQGDDIWRYYLLVAQTLVLEVAAIVCGTRVRESRSARTLFGLSLAMLPAHFGVLGGLVYSRFGLDHSIVALPKHVIWIAPSPASALITLAIALVVLAPTAYFALLSLIRAEAARMLALLFVMNALLLVPIRNPSIAGLEFAVGVLVLVYLESGPFRRSVALGTFEGKLVRVMLAAPIAILAVRAVTLYSPTTFFIGTCLAAFGIALFALGPATGRQGNTWLQTLGALTTSAGFLLAAGEALRSLHVPRSLVLPLIGFPLAAILVVFGRYAGAAGSNYRRAAVAIAFSTAALNLFFGTVGASLSALVLGLLILAIGTYRKRLPSIAAGGGLALAGLIVQFKHAIDFSRVLNWGSLSLLGIALVFVAAYFERHPDRLARAIRTFTRTQTKG